MNRLVSSESIYWCEGDDRYVRVFQVGDEITGLNFMQGDEYELFNDDYQGIDEGLTNFYHATKDYLSGDTRIERVNQAIWAWFEYKNNY
jgi:hypothetical protein